MKRVKKTKDQSYGIIPVYEKEKKLYFLMVLHKAGHWAFPKGHLIGNETPLETAKRELYEETGIKDCKIIKPKNISFEEKYSFEENGQIFDKTVNYFIGLVKNKSTKTPSKFKKEILSTRWATYSEAINLLTYKEAKDMLKKVKEYLINKK